ncbi:secretion-regulating guanine nucleotide exchange factor isoform X2 [Lepisosteus oculatus]|uniref:secretion-regulating guanine nucleotide exchange factor isoform X2 n=1 Tax=Lepisosteus oculatus TaxID=7918 RepID=UPI0035F51A83
MAAGSLASEGLRFFAWGANSHGQLGQGHRQDRVEPGQVEEGDPAGRALRRLAGGGGHSVLLTGAGQLLVCGQNHSGQLGLGHTREVTTFHLCPGPGGQAVEQVACGWDFTLLLTDRGTLYSCGSNAFGQLGVGRPLADSAEPLHIQSLSERVVGLAAGLRHALAVTGSGHVFQWGTGLAAQAKRALCPNPVPAHLNAWEPCLVPGLDHVAPRGVAAGAYHCVCLTGGDVFLWGSNKHKQLCVSLPFLPLPRCVDRALLGGGPATAVWSGWTHLVARTDSGRVFSWGRADYGQLGRPGDPSETGRSQPAGVPAEVDGLAGATEIACGSEHNLAIVGGRLLSWGWNEHGMCGDGTEVNVSQPQPIPALRGAGPLLIGCGAGHSMALCETRGAPAGRP